MDRLDPSKIGRIQSNLLDWFSVNQRPLPWRVHYEPYQVWISEMMLQQTQVKTVLPYFDRWMKAFPDIKSLAAASEEEVLKLWEGLGYYSRARNLHKAAMQIMEKHGGEFPSNFDEILELPGIGKYTASAIASIAFNQDYPVVDGNVIRVISRLMNYGEDTKQPLAEAQISSWADKLFPKGKGRMFNQAMMEFGALQCRPGAPECSKCPLSSDCTAYQKGTVEMLPNRGPKKELENIDVAIAVIRKGDEVFIQKRPSVGLMGGLWEFPGGKIKMGEKPQAALEREIGEEVGIRIIKITPIRVIKHAYTRFKVNLHCFEAEYSEGEIQLNAAMEGRWVHKDSLGDYPFPAANRLLINDLI